MKGIILAAGRGSRLGSETAAVPKPLIEVGGRRCIDFALAALAPVCDEVIVITGYESEQIEAHVAQTCGGQPVRTLRNRSPEAGNLTTLHAAREVIGFDGFIVTNADHLFPDDMYQHYFQSGEAIRIAAERDRTILEDEMKVVVRDGRLARISKTLPEFDGAYIGTTAVSAASASAYWRAFDRVLEDADQKTASVEMVLGELARVADEAPQVCWVQGLTWYEVDNAQDLAYARAGLGR